MIDLNDVESIRPHLVAMCRNPATRINGRSLDVANRWEPMTVREPDTQMLFTEDGAWHFIADQLAAGVNVACLEPSDDFPDHAYFLVEAGGGDKAIYMKIAVRMALRKVVGISFHYSEPKQ